MLAQLRRPWSDDRRLRGRVGPGSFTGLAHRHRDDPGTRASCTASAASSACRRSRRSRRSASVGRRTGHVDRRWIDAHRHEVFSARCTARRRARSSRGTTVEIEAPTVAGSGVDAGTVVGGAIFGSAIFVGDGAAAAYTSPIGAGESTPRIAPPARLPGASGAWPPRRAVSPCRRRDSSALCPAAGRGAHRDQSTIAAERPRAGSIEVVTRPGGHRRVLVIEERVVHQPVDRGDVSGRVRERRRVVLLSRRRHRRAMSSASVRSGACSTSCTSTIWRCCRQARGWGSRRRCSRACSEAARSSARDGATLEVRRSNEAARRCTSGSVLRWPAFAARTTPIRWRMRWCCGGRPVLSLLGYVSFACASFPSLRVDRRRRTHE